ncbi:tetratricopeptide repeat protein [Cohnella yongneupensis]|uniref:Tetratricopeptide repeat protein n=1 Tax=Cohnella yongneupensis TaxID=425006 RepID=A0ABW0R279_9BACL
MAQFYLNSSSREDFSDQWGRYLQEKSFFDDLTNNADRFLINQVTDFRRTIAELSEHQAAVMQDNAEMVSSLFNQGFSDVNLHIAKMTTVLSSRFQQVSGQLHQIEKGIDQLYSLMDWRTSIIIEELRLQSMLVRDISQLLRIPDSQKERQHFIERGCEFFNSAQTNPDFHKDALHFFKKAEEIESRDYFTLFYIGMIYLYAPDCLDVPKAEQYFKLASKYAGVEVAQSQVRLRVSLRSVSDEELSDSEDEHDKLKMIASDSILQLSIACYVQGKFAEAAEHALKLLEQSPDQLEAGFTYVKALYALGSEEKASPILKQVIQKDFTYAVRMASDPDIGTKESFGVVISQLKEEVLRIVSERIQRCYQSLGDYGNSEINDILKGYQEQIESEPTYDAVLKILEDLSTSRSFICNEAIINGILAEPLSIKHYGFATRKELPDAIQSFLSIHRYRNYGISSNGKFMVTISKDKKLNVWNIETEDVMASVNFDKDELVVSASIDPLGAKVVLQTKENFQLWNVATKSVMTLIDGLDYLDQYKVIMDDRFITLCGKWEIIVLDYEGQILLRKKHKHVDPDSIRISRGGKVLAYLSDSEYPVNTELNIMKLDNGSVESVNIGAHIDFQCWGLTISKDNRYILLFDRELTLVWDVFQEEWDSSDIFPTDLSNPFLYEQNEQREEISIYDNIGEKIGSYKHKVNLDVWRMHIFDADRYCLYYVQDQAERQVIRLNFIIGSKSRKVEMTVERFCEYESYHGALIQQGLKRYESFVVKQKIKEEKRNKERLEQEQQAQLQHQQRIHEQQLARNKELEKKIEQYIRLGRDEEERVRKKWFKKDYSEALRQYEKAYERYVDLGNSTNTNLQMSMENLKQIIEELKQKMKS